MKAKAIIPSKLKKIVYLKNRSKYNLRYCAACECCKNFCISRKIIDKEFKHYPSGIKSYIEAHFDHIIPESKGGPTTVDNLQIYCRKCNLKKKNKGDEEFRDHMDYMDVEVNPDNELNFNNVSRMDGVEKENNLCGFIKKDYTPCRNKCNDTGYCSLHQHN